MQPSSAFIVGRPLVKHPTKTKLPWVVQTLVKVFSQLQESWARERAQPIRLRIIPGAGVAKESCFKGIPCLDGVPTPFLIHGR